MAKPENGKNKSLRRKVRNSYFISTLSIALVLFLLGSVGYMILNARKATDRIKENTTVHVMLAPNITDTERAATEQRLKERSEVREAVFVSKEEAAASFREQIEEDFEGFLGFNPLPDAYMVSMNAEHSDNASVKEFEKEVASWSEVDEVVYQKNVIDSIWKNITKFNIILLLFGGALLLISLILLNNTIRLTIYSKRYLINTMKMVGASKWFIMKPFVGRAFLQGLYAWLIAGLLFAGLVVALGEGLPEVTMLADMMPVYTILGAMLVLGLLISVLFTTFAVNKFVNMHSSKIYLY